MSEKTTQRTLVFGDRTIILVGTAHVSKLSVDEVQEAVEREHPDALAIELDTERLKSLQDRDSWKKMDIIAVLKKKQGFLLLANIVLSSYQRKIGEGSGVRPGDEMNAAVTKAQELGIEQFMVDRPVAVTMRRAWAENSFWGKCKLLSMLVATAFSKEKVSEEEIENLKKTSEMDTMMKELADYLPAVKRVLIDERDLYLASKIWSCPGKKTLAVLGAGHLGGVSAHLEKIASGEESPDVSAIESVPKKSLLAKAASWAIPVLIVALIVTGFIVGGIEKGADLVGSWVVWNAALSGLGALVARGHVLAVLTAAVGAPFTSLCPFVGAGLISGIVQALIRKPEVQDMENLQQDAESFKGFYRNKILRVLLVFFFSSVGSSIGTFLGGASFVKIFAQ